MTFSVIANFSQHIFHRGGNGKFRQPSITTNFVVFTDYIIDEIKFIVVTLNKEIFIIND